VASVVLHVALAVVLTGLLGGQARALAAVLRARRTRAAGRAPRAWDLVWVTIPVVVVLFLAARSWTIALDSGSPATAVVRPVEISARPVSLRIFHR
jgi:heme/copper-type cytochrome/quinol oxidase subunit 2